MSLKKIDTKNEREKAIYPLTDLKIRQGKGCELEILFG